MIVVSDGTTVETNAPAYEYSDLKISGGVFKAILPNGASVSGFAGHIVAEVDYQNRDLAGTIAKMERMSAGYAKTNPVLERRIGQFRTMAEKASAGTERQTPPSGPEESAPGSAEPAVTMKPSPAAVPATPPAAMDDAAREAALAATFNDPAADNEARMGAISELAMTPKPEHRDLFTKAARDSDKNLRKWGYRGLGKMKSSEGLDSLLEISRDPAVQPSDRIEIIRQLGRFGCSSNEALAVPAVREMISLLASPKVDAVTKGPLKLEILGCVANGGQWVRGQVAAASGPEIREITDEIAAADARRQAAIELERSMRFTAEDNALLYAYAYGRQLPPRPLEGILDPILIEGRVDKAKRDLAEVQEDIRRGKTISILDGPQSGMAAMYKYEIAELTSEEPLRMAKAALGRLSYLTGKNVQNTQLRDVAAGIADAPLPTYVDYQNGHAVSGPYNQMGDVFGSLIIGGIAAYMGAKVEASTAEVEQIVETMKSLSPGAQKKLGF